MLERIRSRWWIVVLSAVTFVVGATAITYNARPLYTGRVTFIAVQRGTQGPSSEQVPLADLAQVVMSNRVLQDAVDILMDQGSRYTPQEYFGALSVSPVEGKRALRVSVTLPDAAWSRKSARLVAASAKKAWEVLNRPDEGTDTPTQVLLLVNTGNSTVIEVIELHKNRQAPTHTAKRPAGKPVSMDEIARKAGSAAVMDKAARALRSLGSNYTPQALAAATEVQPADGTSTLAIAVTLPDAVEATKAVEVVAAFARLRCPTLRTIDPAYVFLVDRHKLRTLATAFAAGFATGLLLATLPATRRKPGSDPV